MLSARRPSPAVQPPTTTSWVWISAVLIHAGVRRALAADRDDLPVQEDRPPVEHRDQASELGVARRDLVAATALRPDAVAGHPGDGPHTVPLELERPAGTRGRIAGCGEHRRHR